jgi:hypothetical protein
MIFYTEKWARTNQKKTRLSLAGILCLVAGSSAEFCKRDEVSTNCECVNFKV